MRGQVRFPKSKKRRIRAKWAKRAGNFGEIPTPKIYKVRDPDTGEIHFVGRPKTAERVTKQITKGKL